MEITERKDPNVSHIIEVFRRIGIKEGPQIKIKDEKYLIGQADTLLDTGDTCAELKKSIDRIFASTPELSKVRRGAEANLAVEWYLGEYLD